MKIEFSPHAECQLLERNISLNEVIKTLKKPDQIIDIDHLKRRIAQKIIASNGKRFLYRVVFVDNGHSKKIITVYRTTKINKYQREGK